MDFYSLKRKGDCKIITESYSDSEQDP